MLSCGLKSGLAQWCTARRMFSLFSIITACHLSLCTSTRLDPDMVTQAGRCQLTFQRFLVEALVCADRFQDKEYYLRVTDGKTTFNIADTGFRISTS